ncbi:MAG TPA: hypothetical protein VMV45_01875, partial [Casimicrobiaceae bacterium]|nr:hypothetical protein [Casimicrobiaceae bacterium]
MPSELVEEPAAVALETHAGSESAEQVTAVEPQCTALPSEAGAKLGPAVEVASTSADAFAAGELESTASRTEPMLSGDPAWLDDEGALPPAHRMEDPEAVAARTSPPLALNIGSGNDPPWVSEAGALPLAPPSRRARGGWRTFATAAVGALLVVIAAAGAGYVLQHRDHLVGQRSNAASPPPSQSFAARTSEAGASVIKLAAGVDESTARTARATQDALDKGLAIPATTTPAANTNPAGMPQTQAPQRQSIPSLPTKHPQDQAPKRTPSSSTSKPHAATVAPSMHRPGTLDRSVSDSGDSIASPQPPASEDARAASLSGRALAQVPRSRRGRPVRCSRVDKGVVICDAVDPT